MINLCEDFIFERKCPICGKRFAISGYVDRWAYKFTYNDKVSYFCSWSCLQENERNRTDIVKKREDKTKATILKELSGEIMEDGDTYAENYDKMSKKLSEENKFNKTVNLAESLKKYLIKTHNTLAYLSKETGIEEKTLRNYLDSFEFPDEDKLNKLMSVGIFS